MFFRWHFPSQSYPSRFVEADGHARCFMLLDVFELLSNKLLIQMYLHQLIQITNCIILQSIWAVPILLAVLGKIQFQMVVVAKEQMSC